MTTITTRTKINPVRGDGMERLHAVVYGRVQGVSFRAYTETRARQLGLVGWVRNKSDGTVETVAEGRSAMLEAFVAFLHEGSPAARVDEVFVTRTPIEQPEFSAFETRF